MPANISDAKKELQKVLKELNEKKSETKDYAARLISYQEKVNQLHGEMAKLELKKADTMKRLADAELKAKEIIANADEHMQNQTRAANDKIEIAEGMKAQAKQSMDEANELKGEAARKLAEAEKELDLAKKRGAEMAEGLGKVSKQRDTISLMQTKLEEKLKEADEKMQSWADRDRQAKLELDSAIESGKINEKLKNELETQINDAKSKTEELEQARDDVLIEKKRYEDALEGLSSREAAIASREAEASEKSVLAEEKINDAKRKYKDAEQKLEEAEYMELKVNALIKKYQMQEEMKKLKKAQ